jgi:hypothetical protein
MLDDWLGRQFDREDEGEVCADSRSLRVVARPERLDPSVIRFFERRISNTRKDRHVR